MTFATSTIISGAVLSPCGVYRYRLWRVWDADGARAVFVLLNPSTADAEEDDPTVRRCAGFACAWGCGGFVMVNLFAYRATKPAMLKCAGDPVGPENRDHVIAAIGDRREGPVVCGWGYNGGLKGQDQVMLGWITPLATPQCLGKTKAGYPRHPLYVRGATPLIAFP